MPRRAVLTREQAELVGQFNDASFENPGLTFDQVAKKILGDLRFDPTPVGREFKRQAKEVFDRERQK
jgi:hypothetical protein